MHNFFNYGVFLNPHYAKRAKGGEDAACVGEKILCVADGVGGWSESGIDPANYSRRLCYLIEEKFNDTSKQELYINHPKALLVDAVKDNRETGSCTCVIVTLDQRESIISTVNLGDSGYIIVRPGGL